MADTVSTHTVFAGTRRRVYNFLNVSDGTGETAVVKVDKSTLVGPDGTEPTDLVVEMIEWVCDGMRVDLFWDHTSDVKIATLAGSSYIDFTEKGGLQDTGSGETGDIILTTTGPAAGDSYNITLHLRLKD
jgi:hypothetical protein